MSTYLNTWARGLTPRMHRRIMDALLANIPETARKRSRKVKRAASPKRSARKTSRANKRSHKPAVVSTDVH